MKPIYKTRFVLTLVEVKCSTHPLTIVCDITYYGWSDNGPIAGDLISPTNSHKDRLNMTLISY